MIRGYSRGCQRGCMGVGGREEGTGMRGVECRGHSGEVGEGRTGQTGSREVGKVGGFDSGQPQVSSSLPACCAGLVCVSCCQWPPPPVRVRCVAQWHPQPLPLAAHWSQRLAGD